MLSYIEIYQKNLIENFDKFRKYINPKTKIMSVVKGNAYGHGLSETVKILDKKTDYFAVFDIEELDELRKVTSSPCLVLGYVGKDNLEQAIELNGILTIYDLDTAVVLNKIASKKNRKVKIHLKIDAALGRQGVLINQLEAFINQIARLDALEIDGIYAHFANIEDTSDFTHAQKQIDIFETAKKILRKCGYMSIKTHIASSAGTMVYEKNTGINDLVRLGLSLYGMWPSEELKNRFNSQSSGLILKPVLRWVSQIAQVRTLPPLSSIGYGLTYITSQTTKTAVIPQGYSDGYDRGLSNIGEVLIHGTRCRVLGRVMMNMIVVDVTHLTNVKAEDEVVLLGKQQAEEITAEEIALKLGTINYEITTRINPLLKRIMI